ncbi:hypothetical protein KY290_008767 [Solanum tuberosum]|uniref:Uncharacterized protein n=1 Tax=Solanum tuberosum TaxID=4113 RepID=A0ABQ7W9D9_SOLTU|nr:hypothetical protein KY290_008766 [Solanum tuberosum]KAH0777356.1 hypothetical protein KY290_008767 [Solanum tuberosum]
MEEQYKNKKKQSYLPPPKRGQIMEKIVNSLIESVAEFVYGGSENIKGNEKTPGGSPVSFESGVDSDGSYR